MTQVQPHNKLTLFIKFVFVVLSWAAGAKEVRSLAEYNSCMIHNRQVTHAVAAFGAVLLLALLGVAFKLGNRGKSSASWAVLGYGSWMTVFWVGFLDMYRYESGVWLPLIAVTIFTWGGLRAAFYGRWNAVAVWSCWSLILLAVRMLWHL